MRHFSLCIRILSIKLKVRFACSISISVKYHNKEYPIVEDQPLEHSYQKSPIQQIQALEAQIDQDKGCFAEKENINVLLYLHSSHGKLLIGSYLYKLREINNKKVIRQSIKNSPDKDAELQLQIQAAFEQNNIYNKNESSQQNPQTLYQKGNERLKVDPILLRDRIKTSVAERNFQDAQPQPNPSGCSITFNPQSCLKSNVSSKHSPGFLPISPKQRQESHSNRLMSVFDDRKSRIDALQRKVHSKRSVENSQQYLNKILMMEKQEKSSLEKIRQLELGLKLAQNSTKYQADDLKNKKNKIDALQQEIRKLEREKTESEKRSFQQQYAIKLLTQEKASLSQSLEKQRSKNNQKEEQYKDHIHQLTEKTMNIEKQRDDLMYKINKLTIDLQSAQKTKNQKLAQQESKHSRETMSLKNNITELEKLLAKSQQLNKKSQSKVDALEKEKLQAKLIVQRLQRSLQQLETQKRQGQEENEKLQTVKVQLQITSKELKNLLASNNELKQELQQVTQQRQTLWKKIVKFQQQLGENEEKIKTLTEHIQTFEQEYERLYQEKVTIEEELSRTKKTQQELIEEHQHLTKNIENLSIEMNVQEERNCEIKEELSAKNKELTSMLEKTVLTLKLTQQTLLQQKENHNLAQQGLKDAKKQIIYFQDIIQKMQTQKLGLIRQLQDLKKDYFLLYNKNNLLSSEHDELRINKETSEEEFKKSFQMFQGQSKKQLQSLEEKHYNQLTKANEKYTEVLSSKQVLQLQMSQLKDFIKNQQYEKNQLLHKIARFEKAIQTKHQELINQKEAIQFRQSELLKKIAQLKSQVSEKSKQLVQSQNDKKHRINLLTQSMEQIRKQNYELENVVASERNNKSKLNSVVLQLIACLSKMQKAHNIKAYYMMPLRQLLNKLQQIVKTSDKIYLDLGRKLSKQPQRDMLPRRNSTKKVSK